LGSARSPSSSSISTRPSKPPSLQPHCTMSEMSSSLMKSRFPPLPPSSPPFSINNAYVSGLKDELNIQKNEYACRSLFLGCARFSTKTHSRLPSSFRVRVRLAALPRMPASPEAEPHLSFQILLLHWLRPLPGSLPPARLPRQRRSLVPSWCRACRTSRFFLCVMHGPDLITLRLPPSLY
jgi:hypothetical protein